MTNNTPTNRLPDTIRTDRLFLRAPILADAPALQQLANNKTVHKFLARLPHPYTSDHAVDFIDNLARTDEEHAYAITLKNGEFIGVIGIHLDREIGLELGYWLGQPYWGKGYATEAATALVAHAFTAGMDTIHARSISTNKGSIAVLLKTGFLITAQNVEDCGQHHGVPVTLFKREHPDEH